MRSRTASTTSSASSTSDGRFQAIWSRDADGEFTLQAERAAFESLMDLLMARLDADPSMHVYHYAPYEPTALKRLMGRYGTREAEVDRLLREGVLVDLLRGSPPVAAGVGRELLDQEDGGLLRFRARDRPARCRLEHRGVRDVAGAGRGERPETDILERIERYNRDDVVSNQRLRDWLESRRDELIATGIDVPRPAPRETPLPAD